MCAKDRRPSHDVGAVNRRRARSRRRHRCVARDRRAVGRRRTEGHDDRSIASLHLQRRGNSRHTCRGHVIGGVRGSPRSHPVGGRDCKAIAVPVRQPADGDRTRGVAQRRRQNRVRGQVGGGHGVASDRRSTGGRCTEGHRGGVIAAHGGGRRWRSGHRRRHYVVAGQADAADAAVIVEDRIAATHLVGGREFEVVGVTVGQPSKRDGAG